MQVPRVPRQRLPGTVQQLPRPLRQSRNQRFARGPHPHVAVEEADRLVREQRLHATQVIEYIRRLAERGAQRLVFEQLGYAVVEDAVGGYARVVRCAGFSLEVGVRRVGGEGVVHGDCGVGVLDVPGHLVPVEMPVV